MLPVAAQIVSSWLELKNQLNDQKLLLQGKLKLFCSVTASYSHLPAILSEFRLLYPQVEIQLITGDPAQAVDKVLQGEADIAIAAKPEALSAKLTYLELDKVTMSVITPPLIPASGTTETPHGHTRLEPTPFYSS